VNTAERSLLMQRRDRWVEIERWDGATEVLYDVIQTNRPERYPDRWIGFHVYALTFDDIAAVRVPRER
jgi:hypothetical protein